MANSRIKNRRTVCEACRKSVSMKDSFCGNCGSKFIMDNSFGEDQAEPSKLSLDQAVEAVYSALWDVPPQDFEEGALTLETVVEWIYEDNEVDFTQEELYIAVTKHADYVRAAKYDDRSDLYEDPFRMKHKVLDAMQANSDSVSLKLTKASKVIHELFAQVQETLIPESGKARVYRVVDSSLAEKGEGVLIGVSEARKEFQLENFAKHPVQLVKKLNEAGYYETDENIIHMTDSIEPIDDIPQNKEGNCPNCGIKLVWNGYDEYCPECDYVNQDRCYRNRAEDSAANNRRNNMKIICEKCRNAVGIRDSFCGSCGSKFIMDSQNKEQKWQNSAGTYYVEYLISEKKAKFESVARNVNGSGYRIELKLDGDTWTVTKASKGEGDRDISWAEKGSEVSASRLEKEFAKLFKAEKSRMNQLAKQ